MNQDGTDEQHAHGRDSQSNDKGGTMMLTLCTSPEDASPYLHAIIRFPSSYQAACVEALKTFAAYIPPDVEAVSLRQAAQRKDGQHVWCMIPEDEWDAFLERHGEEIGVFLPQISPETIPYRKEQPSTREGERDMRLPTGNITYPPPPKKLIRLYYYYGRALEYSGVDIAVESLANCFTFAEEYSQEKGWRRPALFYDHRMVGEEDDQQLYKTRVQTSGSRPDWRSLSDVDEEIFQILLHKHSEPMAIVMT